VAAPLKTGLPPDCILDGGYIIRLTAVSATTGAVVAGVTVSGVELQVSQLAGPSLVEAPMPFLVPSDQLV